MSAPDPTVGSLLGALASEDAEHAWTEFLASYSAVIYQVVESFIHDVDHRGDCFLYICEQLARNRFRRLSQFKPNGRASFSTWLRAVVRNLCLDWHRRQFGRPRFFRSVAALPAIDQQIFVFIFQRGMSTEQTCWELRAKGHDITNAEIEQRIDTLRRGMTARQLWLLITAHADVQSLDAEGGDCELAVHHDVADPAPGPEVIASLKEVQTLVGQALKKLDDRERLLIRLRFVEGLTLQEVAALLGLPDAQTTDRRVREVLQKLRAHLGVAAPLHGKVKSASV